MTNINVRIVGTANVEQMSTAFGKVQGQVAALNTQLAQMVQLQNGVDARGYDRMARAATLNDRAFRSAVSSTGMFESQQLRVNKATDDYIEKLKKQKMSFRELMKERKTAASAYKEQLAMENMMVRQSANSSSRGKQMLDVVVPRAVSSELDTAGKRLAFFNEQLKSGSHQLVNWGKNTQWAGRQLTVGFTMPLVAAGAAAGVLAYNIDKEFTRIQKVYDTTADANSTAMSDQMAVERELNELREAGLETAMKSARMYGASATDTLAVQAELAATGQKGAELQSATNEVMRIARLGELEYQDALGATISMQTVFRMNTDELAKSFDYMNSIENATSLTTQDFAAAIPIAAAPIKAFGGDIQELGVLLTAMKSRGIQATQGANAIKAAMQRLGRPSKQIQQEWQAITNTDITQIFEQSESLTEIFTKIREATKDLSRQDRTKAFAGLFGTYQVTRMSALVEGIDDIGIAGTQTAMAMDIANQSTEQWAATAEREIERLNESVSGKFKNALEEAKIQMSTLGEPFVEVATLVLKGVTMIISQFNKLPDFAKFGIAAAIGLTAIAGPLVMLAGLFGNLAGNFFKGISNITGLLVKMNILTTEQRAVQLANKLTTTTFVNERTAVQQLTASINAMNAAMIEANSLTIGNRATPGGSAIPDAAAQTRQALTNSQVTTKSGSLNYNQPSLPPMWSSQYHGAKIDNKDYQARMVAESKAARDRIRQQDALNSKVEEEAVARGKGNQAAKAAAASTALMAGSMATMVFSSNQTANNIAQFVMLASIVAPAAQLLVPALQKGGAALKTAGGNAIGVAKGLGGARGAAAGLMTAIRGAGAALWAMTGPIGLAAAGIAALGFGIYKMHQDNRKEIENQISTQKTLNESADAYAQSIGLAKGEWQGIDAVTSTGMPEEDNFRRDVTLLREDENQMKTAAEFADFDDNSEFRRAAMERYIDLMTTYKISAKDATTQIAALYNVSGGLSQDQAMGVAEDIAREIGEIENIDWEAALSNSRDRMADAFNTNVEAATKLEDFESLAEGEGRKVAETFFKAISTAESPQEAASMFEKFNQVALQSFEEVEKRYMDSNPGDWAKLMKNESISSLQDLSNWVKENSEESMVQALIGAEFSEEEINVLISQLNKAAAAESSIIKPYAEEFEFLGGNIETVTDLMDNYNVKAQTMSSAEARNEVFKMGQAFVAAENGLNLLNSTMGGDPFEPLAISADASRGAVRDVLKDFSPERLEDFKTAVEAFAQANNIKINDKSAADTYYNVINNITNAARRGEEAIKGMKNAFEFTQEEIVGIRKDAMTNVQQGIADAIRDDFDERMQSALDSRQAYWDRATQSQEDAFQRQQDAMEARWEKKKDAAEKYWDRRVENIDRAIKAETDAEEKRQRMFDAEIARINRLNDAMNTNIDFNVALSEGRFDEAAKIRNDVGAGAAQSALEAAADAGSGRTDRRVEDLESRLERIEEKRDAYMKRLDKREEAEKRHLDKTQELRKRALQREVDNDMKAQRKIWDNRKDAEEAKLELFLAYVPRNEKELRKHMKNMGLAYDGFGKQLMDRGDLWSKHFGEGFQRNVRQAGLALKSDKMWEKLGQGSMKQVLAGMGFKNQAEFRRFINTGAMNGQAPGSMGAGAGVGAGIGETRHEGGFVGSGGGSRKGVARNLKSLHHSESLVRAQKGEFIVNRTAAKNNAGLLQNINNGSKAVNGASTFGHDGGGKNIGGPGAGLGAGLVKAIAGTAVRGLVAGTSKAMNNAYQKKKNEMAAFSTYSGPMSNRTYSLPGVKPWVYEAAQYLGNKYDIASILGVGSRSNYSEHPLGRALDFMVSDDRGTSLAQDVVNMYKPLDAMYVIWRQRINSMDGRGWRAMEDRGSPTANHMDHVHVSFNSTGDTGDLPALAPAVGSGFSQGTGGRHRPVAGGVISNGLHYNNALDVGVSRGTPVYSVADGIVTGSYDIAGPLATDSYDGDGPYGSYGRVVKISHGAFDTLYAHLSQRFVREGQTLMGGAKIGLSGSTGNSSGPHLHFESHGASPYAFLKTGGTVKRDNTPAILHKDERVLTAPLTKKLDVAVDAMYRAANAQKTLSHKTYPYSESKRKRKDSGFVYPDAVTGLADSPYTWFDYIDLTRGKGRKGKAAAGNRTKKGSGNVPIPDGENTQGFNVKTGTYNLYRKSANARTKEDLSGLMKQSDILSLTEYIGSKRELAGWIKEMGWGLHSEGGAEDAAIIWNKANMEMLRGGSRMLSNKGRKGAFRDRKALYGMFQDKKSGQKFYQVAAHTVGYAQRGNAGWREVMAAQYEGIRNLVSDLKESGLPVFLAGDFNNKPGMSKIPFNFGLKDMGNGGLDRVFASMGKGNTRRISGLSSDHPALLSNFSIPGLNVGGDVKWNNTIANLHKNERVLTAPLTKKLDIGLDNLANNGASTYNHFVVSVEGSNKSAKELFAEFKELAARENSRKPGSRKNS